MIAILDYGLGNVLAFSNVYKRINIPHRVASCAADLDGVDKLILPGVGAFDYAMLRLNSSGMRDVLDELVLVQHVPVLGICVGMQIMAQSSEEGLSNGLGWIEGRVKKIPVLCANLRLPHMGWNAILPQVDSPLLRDVDGNAGFYFLHSYYLQCNRAQDSIAVTEYGDMITCAVNHDNVFGVQFHPEKSHRNGVKLLENFGGL